MTRAAVRTPPCRHRDCNRTSTAGDTTGAHAVGMGCGGDETGHESTTDDEALPELNPCRQVGWLFHDDGCVAIARQGEGMRPDAVLD